MSAIVAKLIKADALLILTDIDGLYTDDPHNNPNAKFIGVVEKINEDLLQMGKGTTGSSVGTGGMATKLNAAQIATSAGTDMVIASGKDFHIIHRILDGRDIGTLFVGNRIEEFRLIDYLSKL